MPQLLHPSDTPLVKHWVIRIHSHLDLVQRLKDVLDQQILQSWLLEVYEVPKTQNVQLQGEMG